ncbi:hypothetical protein KI688_001084 [Linnemannia hyalina]|uniref:HPP transmembrane region domain-containing protein n=1 Tax=Linnemannia hyalina TaxID=64524 RepID=A0A9P7Y5R9_9FUNG|nr:hypothetical protein KI688_001084 [Linnemannia hyalina]
MVSPAIQTYFSKMKGQRYDPKRLKSPPKPPTRIQVLVSTFIGSFIGIAIVASMTYNSQWFLDRNTPVIAGSFGASAVLIYGAIEAPLSQPRNVIGGHIMASFIGVSLYKLFNLMSTELFNRLHWLLCSLAVSISLFVMQVTHTVHPPASASALIAVTGGQAIYDLGYWYLLCPIALGVALMMIVAMLVNNVVRTYPSHWWAPKSRIIHVVDQDMTTTLADFMPPDDDDEDEDEQEKEGQKAERDGVASSPLGNNNNKSSTHHPTISSSSSLTFSPLDNHSSPNHPPTSITPHPAPIIHTHTQPQYAVYYGGDHKEELRDGEMLQELHSGSSSSPKDLEHGHGPHGLINRRHSIMIGLRGSTHPIARTTSSGTTVSHVTATEEEYRATIEQLQQRILDLESRLAAVPADSGAGSN